MTQTTSLHLALRHDRGVLLAGLLLAIALAWAWLFAGAGMGMSGVAMTRMSIGDHALMDMPMMTPAHWSLGYAALMFCMWWIMMVAMMLPSAAPVILLAAALNRAADPVKPPFGKSSAFAWGYLLGWGVFSALAVAAQWGLVRSGVLADMLLIRSQVIAGGVMIVAGLWQFSSYKQACLRHCRSPVRMLTESRRRGTAGALSMGLHHSMYCVGCCWFLMLLLFVGGVMNLFWIVALTVYVWLEKSRFGGRRVSRAAGAALIIAGIVTLL